MVDQVHNPALNCWELLTPPSPLAPNTLALCLLHHMHQDGSTQRCRQEVGEARAPQAVPLRWQQPPHRLPRLRM